MIYFKSLGFVPRLAYVAEDSRPNLQRTENYLFGTRTNLNITLDH